MDDVAGRTANEFALEERETCLRRLKGSE